MNGSVDSCLFFTIFMCIYIFAKVGYFVYLLVFDVPHARGLFSFAYIMWCLMNRLLHLFD